VGYIRADGAYATENIVLTNAGLAVLKKTPSGLNPSVTVGEKITEVAQTVGKEAGHAAISSVIGDVIGSFAGGFTKSFLS
jgi:glycerol uptake facilitator-like aquaporin